MQAGRKTKLGVVLSTPQGGRARQSKVSVQCWLRAQLRRIISGRARTHARAHVFTRARMCHTRAQSQGGSRRRRAPAAQAQLFPGRSR
jgi:hypothetical protein